MIRYRSGSRTTKSKKKKKKRVSHIIMMIFHSLHTSQFSVFKQYPQLKCFMSFRFRVRVCRLIFDRLTTQPGFFPVGESNTIIFFLFETGNCGYEDKPIHIVCATIASQRKTYPCQVATFGWPDARSRPVTGGGAVQVHAQTLKGDRSNSSRKAFGSGHHELLKNEIIYGIPKFLPYKTHTL